MARLSRADRKRINTRIASTSGDVEVPFEIPQHIAEPVITSPSKTLRTTRRVGKLTSDTINYTAEYDIIAHDLRRITFWGVLLMAAVIGLSFSGLV